MIHALNEAQTWLDGSGPIPALGPLPAPYGRPDFNNQLSVLPGQRLNACVCKGEDHPGPWLELEGRYRGRGSPEIDILEAVNRATNNQMTLHTSPGCTQPAGVVQSGMTSGSNCSAGTNSSDGCTVIEEQPNSYGAGFNDAGGGVWATQFDVSGIL